MTKTMVVFKSIPENYKKEKSGAKNNTLRKVDPGGGNDVRFTKLFEKKAQWIKIVNTETGESFDKKITDITFWDGYCIISWSSASAEREKERHRHRDKRFLLWRILKIIDKWQKKPMDADRDGDRIKRLRAEIEKGGIE